MASLAAVAPLVTPAKPSGCMATFVCLSRLLNVVASACRRQTSAHPVTVISACVQSQ